MIVVTEWVAALPGAIGRMAAFGIGPLIAASIGIVLLGLLRTPLRWSGAVVLLLATIWAIAVQQPAILIAGDGHNVGVRGKDGQLHLMRSAKDAFLVKEWLAADADPRLPADATLSAGVFLRRSRLRDADGGWCVRDPGVAAGGAERRLRARRADCDGEPAAVQLRGACDHASIVCGGRVPWRCGERATALPSTPSSRRALTGHGRRRWQARARLSPRSCGPLVAPRAVDATPSEADLQSED